MPVFTLIVTDELGFEADRLRLGLGLEPTGTTEPSFENVSLPERERLRPCLSLREFLS